MLTFKAHFLFSINVLLPVEVAHLGHCRGYCVSSLNKKVYTLPSLSVQFLKIEYNVDNLFGSRKNLNKSSFIKKYKKLLALQEIFISKHQN